MYPVHKKWIEGKVYVDFIKHLNWIRAANRQYINGTCVFKMSFIIKREIVINTKPF